MIVKFHTRECISCRQIYPIYETLISQYPDYTFGEFQICEETKEFALQQLQLTVVPMFDVYQQGERIFRTSSESNIHQLTNFLEAM